MLNIFFAAGQKNWVSYEAPLKQALTEARISARIMTETPSSPETVDYIIFAPNGVISDFTPYSGTRAVLSLWAGVEKLVTNKTLSQPLCRMVDPGLTEGMVEYVVGHVLRHHLGMDLHIVNRTHRWDPTCPPLARERPVGVMGMGALGAAVIKALKALNFPVSAWGRSPKDGLDIPYYYGNDGLKTLLNGTQILVTLLPDTAQTIGLLNAERFGFLPKGAVLINPGRGTLIVDAALIAALDKGVLSHATLDVFHQEPLVQDHPFWRHPKKNSAFQPSWPGRARRSD